MTDLELENAELRAALSRAHEDIISLKRERDIASKGRAMPQDDGVYRRHVLLPECDRSPRVRHLEEAVTVLDAFASMVAASDCYSDCDDPDALRRCNTCEAEEALARVAGWEYGGSREVPMKRFVGSRHERTSSGWNPREEKIHRAWASRSSDRVMNAILCDSDKHGSFFHACAYPDARDWYVATSVVQWLATNVGMGVLEAAGFKYTQWDEDTAALDAKRRAIRAAKEAPGE